MTNRTRNSAVELLRILAMCGVVLLHYNNSTIGGGLAFAEGTHYAVLAAVEALFICAVNVYVLISGYYLCQTQTRRAGKMLELLAQVILLGPVCYLISCIGGGGWSLKGLLSSLIPENYFVTLYLVLYVFSPYLNLLFDRLSHRQMYLLTGLMIAAFSLWVTAVDTLSFLTGYGWNGLSTVSAHGSQRGYSLIQFALMYTLGAWIRRNEGRLRKVSQPVLAVVLLGSTGGIYLWSWFDNGAAWAYCNPFVILSACAALLLCLRKSFQSKIVDSLAKGAFPCYLIHTCLLGWFGIEQAVALPLPLMLGHAVFTAVVCYLVGWGFSLLWNRFPGRLLSRLGGKFHKIDNLLSIRAEEISK